MKKFLACVFLIAAAVTLVFYSTGGSGRVEGARVVRLAEAAFSSGDSRFKDATGFLVGDFALSDGTEISFEGNGGLVLTQADGTEIPGEYQLAGDSEISMIRIRAGRQETLYRFELGSAQGDVVLTGVDGDVLRMTPIS